MTAIGQAVVYVSDMDRSAAFYRDVLGLAPERQSPERTEFATGGMTLALRLAGKPAGAAAVQGEIAGRCQLGFSVGDIETFHRLMVAKGVLCIQPPTGLAGRLAVYADPDGLPFSVRESGKP
jgi:catechol 2,3-dioxygenase-like lactoylglutathione lyase family enzyme